MADGKLCFVFFFPFPDMAIVQETGSTTVSGNNKNPSKAGASFSGLYIFCSVPRCPTVIASNPKKRNKHKTHNESKTERNDKQTNKQAKRVEKTSTH